MKGFVIQALATLIITIGNFMIGFTIAWSSYALEILEGEQSPLGHGISPSQSNLVSSLLMLGSVIITPVGGWIGDALGRKRSLILIALSFVLGWSILATAKNIASVLISRVILGMANGAQIVISMPFISEIGSVETKGPLLSFSILLFTIGTLASYLSGWLMSYQAVNYFCLSLSVAYVCLLSFLKESPSYLLLKGDEKEALNSLKFYRGVSKTTLNVLEEFSYLKGQSNSGKDVENDTLCPEKEKLKEEMGNQEKPIYQEESAWTILRTSKSTQRALLISFVHVMLLIFGGTIGVTAYAGSLFSKGAPGLSKHWCSIVLSIAFVIGSLLSTVANGLMSRRVLKIFFSMPIASGIAHVTTSFITTTETASRAFRRTKSSFLSDNQTLQISSAIMSSIILAVLASMLHWSWAPEWMIPASVLAYCCCFQMGVASVIWVQMGEMFASKVKNLVFVIVTTGMNIGNLIVMASFNPAVDHIGLDGTFLVFSLVCILTAIVSYFTMKETKGVPLEEIQRMFESGYLYIRRK